MTGLIHKILTRLRQKGKPWAMMLMLNILSTFWGGNGSLETSFGSARSRGWLSSGTCKVFSFPQATFGIFLRAPDDEKRGIGQCRSIAKKVVYWIISQKVIRTLADYCCKQITFLEQMLCLPYNWLIDTLLVEPLHLPTQNLSPCWLAPFKISLECEVTVAPKPGRAAAVRAWKSLSPSDRHRRICSHDPLDGGMCTISRPTQHTCPGSFLIVVILLWPPLVLPI